MPSNHVSTSSSLCSPSNVGCLILFISPFNSSTLDLQCFLVGYGLGLLHALLLEWPWEWWWCLPTLLDFLTSEVWWLLVFLKSLSLSNLFSILSRLLINFKLNSPCCSLSSMSFLLSSRWVWASFYNLSMIFIIFPSLSIYSPCPLEFDPSNPKWTYIPLASFSKLEEFCASSISLHLVATLFGSDTC